LEKKFFLYSIRTARMNNPRISEKNVTSVIVVLGLCVTSAVVVGISLSESVASFTNNLGIYLGLISGNENKDGVFTPDPTLFTSPSIPKYSPIKEDTAPIRKTRLQPGFYVSSNYHTSEFFREGTSYFRISIKNEGRNSIFIYKYGVSFNTSKNHIYSRDSGTLLLPGEEKNLGIITVEVPEEEKASYKIVLWLFASTSEGKWYEYEPYFMNEFNVNLKPMPEKIAPDYRYNPVQCFEIINQLVEPAKPEVRDKAAEVARSYPGAYNIYQICALFDMVREDIEYISDPRSNDIWEPANVTLRVGAGDCEDQAILLSSMIEAIGGTTRIYLTDNHAFTGVYIGNGDIAIQNAVKGVRTYYGDVDVNYITDKYGTWLMLDPTSSLYAGGLPGFTAQTKTQDSGKTEVARGWTFLNTTKVDVIDINPNTVH
jgi:transglutaminase-like putative cysteine protease